MKGSCLLGAVCAAFPGFLTNSANAELIHHYEFRNESNGGTIFGAFTYSAVPVPVPVSADAWLFGSGLAAMSKLKKAA